MLRGSRTTTAIRDRLDRLGRTLPDARADVVVVLDHFGPEGRTAAVVAARAAAFLR